MCLFLKLQAHAQGAKVVALSSVVTGKKVESETIVLHRELESEFLSFYLSNLFIFFTLFAVCLALLFLLSSQLNYSSQIEMSSTETENKHKSYRFKYYYNKCVITIVMFWPSCHALNGAAAYVENVMRQNVLEFLQHQLHESNVGCLWYMKRLLSSFVCSDIHRNSKTEQNRISGW